MTASPREQQPTGARPFVSVVVPVHNGGAELEACLAAIAASTYANFECVVVDDASTGEPARRVADPHGARSVRLDRRGGPARARNVGAEAARGDLLFFTDADVCIHPDAIDVAVDALVSDPSLSAVFGSYDDSPGHPSLLSQYRNLYHHWVHQNAHTDAFTFWTGLGAIWRDVYLEAGGLSESYRHPSIEDIELGSRLQAAGHRIRLEKAMQGKHLKRWTPWNLVKTDVFRRGAPWVALLLQRGSAPLDLNLDFRSRLGTAIAAAFTLSLVVLAAAGHAAATLPALALLLASALGAKLSDLRPDRRLAPLLAALTVGAPLAAWALAPGPGAPDPLASIPLGLVLCLVATEFGFYRYAARKLGGAFAVAMVPLRLVYFLGCLAAIPLGVVAFLRRPRPGRTGLATGR